MTRPTDEDLSRLMAEEQALKREASGIVSAASTLHPAPGHDENHSLILAAEFRAGLATSQALKNPTLRLDAALKRRIIDMTAPHAARAGERVAGSDNLRTMSVAAHCMLTGNYAPLEARSEQMLSGGVNSTGSPLYHGGWSCDSLQTGFICGVVKDSKSLPRTRAYLRVRAGFYAAFAGPVPSTGRVRLRSATVTDLHSLGTWPYPWMVLQPGQRYLFPTGDHSGFLNFLSNSSSADWLALMAGWPGAKLSDSSANGWNVGAYCWRILSGSNAPKLWSIGEVLAPGERNLLRFMLDSGKVDVLLLRDLTQGAHLRSTYHALRYSGGVQYGAVEAGYFGTKPEVAVSILPKAGNAELIYPGVYRSSQHDRSKTTVSVGARKIVSIAGGRTETVALPPQGQLVSHLRWAKKTGWRELVATEVPPTPPPPGGPTLPAPTLLSPAEGAVVEPGAVELRCAPVAGATVYNWAVTLAGSPAILTATEEPRFVTDLESGSYWWTVGARRVGEAGPAARAWGLTVRAGAKPPEKKCDSWPSWLRWLCKVFS